MDKDKAFLNVNSTAVPSSAPANLEDSATTNVDESRPKPEAAGGGGGVGLVSSVFGTRPANFFELLAAAISATKMEQQKGPDFLEYLRKSGIKMAWVRAIVALYEEPKKPDDPLAYIVKLMGLGIPEQIDVKRMQDQVARLRIRLLSLQAENLQLREAIESEEEALRQKEEFDNIFDESKYFSDYNSDDDSGAEETQQMQNYSSYVK